MKRALLAATVPAAILAGGLAVRALLATAPARFAPDLAQPLPVVTGWGAFGAQIFAVFLLALGIAALAALRYANEIAKAENEPSEDRTVWFAGAAALAAALAWPAVFSSDTYAYAAYGELTQRGIDPYLPVAPGLHGTFVDLARWQWKGAFPPCVYGTGFAAFARDLVAVFGSRDPARTLFAFRALGALAWLADAYAFALVARSWFPQRRKTALALFLLNPLGVWCAAEGHNDGLMLLLALLGALALARGAFLAGGLAFGLTPLLKASGALAGPLLGLYFWRSAGRPRLLELASGFALGLALSGLLLARPMWQALGALRAHGSYAPQVSLQSLTGAVPAIALAFAAALLGLRALARGDATGAPWLALAVPIALPNPYPWYMMWVLPVAAAARAPAGTWLWIGTIAGSLRYLPDVLGPLGSDSNMLAACLTLLPLAVVGALLLRPGIRRRESPAAP